MQPEVELVGGRQRLVAVGLDQLQLRQPRRPAPAGRAPATPPIRKARRWKTPCRSLTSLKKIVRVGHRKRTSASSNRSISRCAKGYSSERGEILPAEREAGSAPRRVRDAREQEADAEGDSRRGARTRPSIIDRLLAGDQPAHRQHRAHRTASRQSGHSPVRPAPEQVEEEAQQQAARTAPAPRAGSPPRRRPAPAGTPARAARSRRCGSGSARKHGRGDGEQHRQRPASAGPRVESAWRGRESPTPAAVIGRPK